MKSLFSVVLILCSVVKFGLAADQSQPTGDLPAAERAFIATQIYTSIKANFGHWRSVPDFDLEKEYKAYLQEALTGDRKTFDLATIAFVAKLHNAHSRFQDNWLTNKYDVPIGVYAYPIEGRWTVTKSTVPELKRGDVIETIDGESIESFYRRNSTYLGASDERWARRLLFDYRHLYLFPPKFVLGMERERKVTITSPQPLFKEDEHIEVKTQPDYVYIRIPSFANPVFEQEAVDAVAKASSAKAIIIDVRDNAGGTTPQKFIDALMDRPYRWWSQATPQSVPWLENQGWGKHIEAYWYGDVSQPKATAYKGRVFILVDGGCFSACEDFVVGFKDNHRAVLIGERTGGSTGQPVFRTFDNGMLLQVGNVRAFLPNGGEFEGVGIEPDVEVKLTVNALKQGKDEVLERAERLIREKQ